ncbi:MAG TPA: hypothetical protein VFG14_04620 [Chthoniobacteraceae bacterium]|nr:hypothetical protein [Chthoniobacteraceae bacterium]
MNPGRSLLLMGLTLPLAMGARADMSPRDAYNEGTKALEKGNLRESESWLLRATSSQKETLQPPALYNLGHVRFQQGRELLKGEAARQPMVDRADSATDEGGDAISNADRALKSDDLMAILEAYMNGRATRKELRLANEDVQRALDLYGSVLVRWRRSVGDFRSSDELRDSKDSKENAKTVERHIEELLKHKEQLEQQKQAMAGMRSELKKKMAELKKKIPEGMIQPGEGEEEEEEEDEKGQPKPESGWQDRGGREGEQRGITPEIAQQILEALGLTGDRKLPLGGEEQAKPRDRKGKDW